MGPGDAPLPASVFFPAGESMVAVDLVAKPDANVAEGNETFSVTINPSSLNALVVPESGDVTLAN